MPCLPCGVSWALGWGYVRQEGRILFQLCTEMLFGILQSCGQVKGLFFSNLHEMPCGIVAFLPSQPGPGTQSWWFEALVS